MWLLMVPSRVIEKRKLSFLQDFIPFSLERHAILQVSLPPQPSHYYYHPLEEFFPVSLPVGALAAFFLTG